MLNGVDTRSLTCTRRLRVVPEGAARGGKLSGLEPLPRLCSTCDLTSREWVVEEQPGVHGRGRAGQHVWVWSQC